MAIGAPSESPAIVVKEVDLTGGVPNVQSTTGAFVGTFRWGPVEERVLISDESRLAERFGNPDTTHTRDFHTAAYFLKYANSLFVTRVVDTDALNAADSDASLIKNDDDFNNQTALTGTFYARAPGDLGNSLKIAYTNGTGWSNWNSAYKSQFDGAPTGDEKHILVIDEDGVITGTAGTVLERFPFVQATAGATNADGSTNYMVDVVNRSSDYLFLAGTTAFNDSAADVSLTSGSNGTAVGTADLQAGWDLYQDKDTTTIDFMIAPGMNAATDQDTMAEYLIDFAETDRKDCLVVTSPAYETVVGNNSAVNDTVTWADGVTFSSYSVIDNQWLKVYDKYNDQYIWIPAASSTAGLMALSDFETAPWFSPAGPRRGRLIGVTSLAYNPPKTDRDTLYKAGVNPIANLPGQGVLLYGDKTHLNRPSAFDRINVRRLFNVIERAISLAARNTLFEFNDEFTRAEFVNIVEPFLREVKGRRGITDFRVVCDETNNTPAIIDRNEFVANIFIKPSRSINYITLNFVAVRTGVDFEEVAGQSF